MNNGLAVGGRIILIYNNNNINININIYRRKDGKREWTGFIWQRIGAFHWLREYGNELSGSIEGEELFDQLKYYKVFQKDSALEFFKLVALHKDFKLFVVDDSVELRLITAQRSCINYISYVASKVVWR
jgi:hypothetical protein